MRWIFRIGFAILFVGILAMAALFVLPAEKIGAFVSAQLERSTGRKLLIEGEFSPTLFPVLGARTGAVKISNADWAEQSPMLEASSVVVGVDLSALWGASIDIQTLQLQDAVIRLERHQDGRVNWDFSGADTSDGSNSLSNISLLDGRIKNGRVIFVDHQNGQQVDIQEIQLEAAIPKGGLGAEIQGQALWNGQQTNLDLTVTSLSDLLNQSNTTVKASFSSGGTAVSINGALELRPAGSPMFFGTLEGRVNSIDQAMVALGRAVPVNLAGLSDVNIAGELLLSDDEVSMEADLAMRRGELPVTGKILARSDSAWMESLRFYTEVELASPNVMTLDYKGWINGVTQNADGQLAVNMTDMPKALPLLGVPAPDMPNSTGKSAIVEGKLRLRGGTNLGFSNAKLAMDGNPATGELTIQLKEVPYVKANLTAEKLDFTSFFTDSSEVAPSGTGWSKERISLAGLDGVDADIVLKAKSVNLGVAQLGRTDVAGKLRNGKLDLRLNQVRAFDGVLTGRVNLRGGRSNVMRSDVKVTGMQLEPLLGNILEFDWLTGLGSAQLKLSGQGDSLHSIMTSLSGDGSLDIKKGAIKGIDLAAMLRNLKKAFSGLDGATEFTRLSGTFSMKKGVLTNTDMEMISPLFKVAGLGKVNIGGQSMAYTVTPTSLSDGAKFSVPVIISGPWSNLKFKPDLKQLLNLALTKDLEGSSEFRAAKEKLNKVKTKLKDPEQAVKKKLKKELRKRLGGDSETDQVAKKKKGNSGANAKSTNELVEDAIASELNNLLKGLKFD